MRKHKDDIPIGEDEWIEFINLEGQYDQAVEIDQYLEGLKPLIEKLDTQCLADCCGFDAFDFTRAGIYEALDDMDCDQLLRACVQAQNQIKAIDSNVVVSTRMNNLADRQVLMKLLMHIENCIRQYASQQDGTTDAFATDDL